MNNALTPYRVAIYFAPAPESAWWQLGSEWLGRCAYTQGADSQPSIQGVAPEVFAALTAEPRRYGWHATLKAPFRLAADTDLEALRREIRKLCAGRQAFELTPLRVSRLERFLALRPEHPQDQLHALAADCVQALQPWAMPLSPQELARRRKAGLTDEQDALMQSWGYPYVLQHFQFHMSLTGSIEGVPDVVLMAVQEAAEQRFHALHPCQVDRLSLFVEPTQGADFCLLEQFQFES